MVMTERLICLEVNYEGPAKQRQIANLWKARHEWRWDGEALQYTTVVQKTSEKVVTVVERKHTMNLQERFILVVEWIHFIRLALNS